MHSKPLLKFMDICKRNPSSEYCISLYPYKQLKEISEVLLSFLFCFMDDSRSSLGIFITEVL